MDEILSRIESGAHFMNAPDPRPPPQDDPLLPLRKPPHSNETEQSLLGVLIEHSSAFAKVSEQIDGADFYSESHRLIFSAISSLMADAKPVDVVTVFERLGTQAEDCGGLSYINALASSVPNASGVSRYAEIIKERAILRATIAQLDLATARAFKQEPAGAILDDVKVALAKISEQRTLGSKRMPLLSPSQLRDHAHSVNWLIKNIIPSDSVGMVFGASQAFKSFVTLDAALHVARGLPWLGRRTKQGPVIYIAAEGGSGIWKRIEAWHKARRLIFDDSVPLRVLPLAVDLRTDAWRVVEAVQVLGIHPAMVVVDTVSQTYSGEENSASDMAGYLRELGTRFRALWNCAVALIHHAGHSNTERPRGSSAILANLDWAHGVFRDEKEMLATLMCAKQKDGEPFQDMTFALTSQQLGTDEDGDKVTSLVARHLTNVEEVQEAMEAESKAGRGGHHTLFLSLLQNGSKESDLRKAFYEQCGLSDSDSRKRTYNRVRAWAMKQGFVEFVEGYVLTLKGRT